MIVTVVPTEDPDESSGEGSNYGGSVGGSPKVKSTRLRGRRFPRTIIVADRNDFGWRLASLFVCSCLAFVGICASLAVLAMYPKEAVAAQPVFVVFSAIPAPAVHGGSGVGDQTPSTMWSGNSAVAINNALAWLVARLLRGEAGEKLALATESAFLPEEAFSAESVVRFWRPLGYLPADISKQAAPAAVSKGATTDALHSPYAASASAAAREGLPAEKDPVLVFGSVAGILSAQHSLGPPQVRSLWLTGAAKQAGQSTTKEYVNEADAILSLRATLEADRTISSKKPVLVSHPHKLPYLALLAHSVGLPVEVIHPGLFDAVPWETFGCNALGYPEGASPQEEVALEESKLTALARWQQEQNPPLFSKLVPLIRSVNATLRFHSCVVRSRGTSLMEARHACRRA